ncbi:MAG: YHS domain-containing protein [FCB group bacterium]|nr:YHS domain-containing protein [FCB group bacterium]
MNRCITCGKIVTKPKAQNLVEREGHTYLLCCPLCEEEFNRDPEHYMAVAQSVFGNHTLKAHSQKGTQQIGEAVPDERFPENPHLLRNLQSAFAEIERSYADLYRHFDQISESGTLGGLRKALRDHWEMMESLQQKMAVHAGVCRFVVSVAESPVKVHTRK